MNREPIESDLMNFYELSTTQNSSLKNTALMMSLGSRAARALICTFCLQKNTQKNILVLKVAESVQESHHAGESPLMWNEVPRAARKCIQRSEQKQHEARY